VSHRRCSQRRRAATRCVRWAAANIAPGNWSDARYAGLLVRSRISQGYGPLRISAELSSRGIDAALIHSALAEAEPDWSSVIRKVYERRYDAAPESAKERASRYRFLAARGFTSDQIRAVMQGLAEDD
jgi:regulatory protein